MTTLPARSPSIISWKRFVDLRQRHRPVNDGPHAGGGHHPQQPLHLDEGAAGGPQDSLLQVEHAAQIGWWVHARGRAGHDDRAAGTQALQRV